MLPWWTQMTQAWSDRRWHIPAGTGRHCCCLPSHAGNPTPPPPVPRNWGFPQGNRLPVCFWQEHRREQLSSAPPGKLRAMAPLSRGHSTAAARRQTACVGWHPPPHRAAGGQDCTETLGDSPLAGAVPGSHPGAEAHEGSRAAADPAGVTAAAAPTQAESPDPPLGEEREKGGADGGLLW